MRFNELLPILSGLFAGALLYSIPKSRRTITAIPLILSFGLFATFVSGEYTVSWAFALIDITLVAGSAIVGFGAVHYSRLFLQNSQLKKPQSM